MPVLDIVFKPGTFLTLLTEFGRQNYLLPHTFLMLLVTYISV